MPIPRDYTEATLQAVTLEARKLFDLPPNVPIMFVEVIPKYRHCWGLYDLLTKIIYVKKRGSIFQMVETLMHEIVHAKQHKLGVISLTKNNNLVYRNKPVFNEDYAYKDMPWEIQANKYMKPMFESFMKKASVSLVRTLERNEATFRTRLS